jgi:hypothetical protein
MSAKFAVLVKEEAGVRRVRNPVTVGLPFARGELGDVSRVRLAGPQGEIAVQLSAASHWEDGSTRWVHARFQIDLDAGGEVELIVDITDNTAATGGPPLVTREAGGWCASDPQIASWLAVGGAFASTLTIIEVGGAVHKWRDPDLVEIEEDGPVYASVFESGPLEDGQGRRDFRYERRSHCWRGFPGVHVEWTFLSVDGDPVAELCDVRLDIPGMGRIAQATTAGGDGPIGFSLEGSALALRQECVYEHDPGGDGREQPDPRGLGAVDFSYRFQVGDEIREGEKYPGWFAFEGVDGSWGLGVRPFWQMGPKEVSTADDGSVAVCLAAPHDALRFGRTRAITHDVFLAAGDGAAELIAGSMHPLVPLVDPEQIGRTEALPYVSPPQNGLFPEYEKWFDGGFRRWRRKAVEYGLLHYGDWRIAAGSYQTFPSYFGHHEYDTMHSLLTHFARTGDRDYFREGGLAARHYADVDIDQVTGMPRFHGYQDTADRHVETFGMEWGHIFADGLVDHYLFTGDRRSLRAATRVADACARETVDALELLQGSERNVGLPLLALLRVYELTGDEEHLAAAKRLADAVADFSLDPVTFLIHGTWWRTWMHESSQTTLACELLVAMARYVDLTDDERVRRAFVAAIDWYVEHTWDPERKGGIGQWNRYQRSHAHSPNRVSGGGGALMLAFPFALGYKYSGEARFMKVAWDAFAEGLAANPPADEDRAFTTPRLFAPHFLALAAQLGNTAESVLRTEVLAAPLDGSLRAMGGGGTIDAQVHGRVETVDSPWGAAARTSDAGWLSYPTGSDVLTKPGSISFWIRTEDDYTPAETGSPKGLAHNMQGLIYIASELPDEMEQMLFRNALELHIIYRALWLKVYDWRGWITTSVGAPLEAWGSGEWHHIVGTWNNYNVTIHLDGEEVARNEGHCLPGGAQKRLFVGWRPMNWYGYCAWHDLRLHGSPLPPSRVKEIWAEGVSALT